MEKYHARDIDDQFNRISEQQAEDLIKHCNHFRLFPNIFSWYDDVAHFCKEWCDDHPNSTKEYAKKYFEKGLITGEFKMFSNGQIIQLVLYWC